MPGGVKNAVFIGFFGKYTPWLILIIQYNGISH